jgi:hypothetical protein
VKVQSEKLTAHSTFPENTCPAKQLASAQDTFKTSFPALLLVCTLNLILAVRDFPVHTDSLIYISLPLGSNYLYYTLSSEPGKLQYGARTQKKAIFIFAAVKT